MSARGIAAQVQRCRTACSAEIAAALFGFHLASERFGDEHSGRTFAEVGCEPLLRLGIGARAVEGHLSEMKRGRCGAVSARKSLAKRAVCRGGAQLAGESAVIDSNAVAQALAGGELAPHEVADLWLAFRFSAQAGSSLVHALLELGAGHGALPFALAL